MLVENKVYPIDKLSADAVKDFREGLVFYEGGVASGHMGKAKDELSAEEISVFMKLILGQKAESAGSYKDLDLSSEVEDRGCLRWLYVDDAYAAGKWTCHYWPDSFCTICKGWIR